MNSVATSHHRNCPIIITSGFEYFLRPSLNILHNWETMTGMLTVFSTPKPFHGHSGIIQRNALQSWTLLHPDVEVILFGDEDGAAETCRDLGIRHEPQVRRNENGTKFLSYIFDRANEIS